MTDRFLWMDAVAQADLVRRKEVKPIELVDAAIARIERVNSQLNAVITPMVDQAREAALNSSSDGPLAGVPYLLKDLLAAYAGVRLACGSALCRDFVAGHDSELVTRLKRAGLIVIGKTNTPEFGILPTTEPALFGPTRNPWDVERATGGSSGGSAAAVAAGLVAAAHANDGGGSIRIPASCCGVFGLKPTRARNPLGPDFGDMFSGLVVEHAVTRSVRDSAALLDATSGPSPGDPYFAPAPERPFLQEIGVDPGRLKIAFTTSTATGVPVHDDCVEAVRDAAALCSDLGHEIVEAAPDVNGEMLLNAFMTVWAAGCAWQLDLAANAARRELTSDLVEPGTWALYQMGKRRSAADYLLALQTLQAICRKVAVFFQQYDIWLTPTLAEPPVRLGWFDSPPENPMLGMARAGAFVPFTPICNITGQPAMSVPLYWNAKGLPVGTHFVGRFGEESTLFRLASQLEGARPWGDRRPPVHA